MRRLGRAAVSALALLATACGEGRGPDATEPWRSPIPFDTVQAWIHHGADSVPLLVELAASDAQRQFGLMTRPTLDEGSGMVFVYDEDQPSDAGFYMFRTLVPLDIAFLDSVGTIDTILAMTPCPSPYPESCPVYQPGVSYRSALEVNQGWFERHGIGAGARVEIDRSQQNRAVGRP